MHRPLFCARRSVGVISPNACTPAAKARIRTVVRRPLKRPLRPCRIGEFFSIRTPVYRGTKKVLSDAQADAGYYPGLFCGGAGEGGLFKTLSGTNRRRPHAAP